MKLHSYNLYVDLMLQLCGHRTLQNIAINEVESVQSHASNFFIAGNYGQTAVFLIFLKICSYT